MWGGGGREGDCRFLFMALCVWLGCTVKRFDEVVQHLHLVTQDQFSLVSKKYSGIHEENCNINIEVFRQTFTNVELLRYKHVPNFKLFR